MEAPAAEKVSSMVFALICLITYELLAENIQDAGTHLQGLRGLLESHGGLRYVLPTLLPRPYRRCIRWFEIGEYAEHCVDGNGAQNFPYKPDGDALSRRLAAHSRFPTLVGNAPHARMESTGLPWISKAQASLTR